MKPKQNKYGVCLIAFHTGINKSSVERCKGYLAWHYLIHTPLLILDYICLNWFMPACPGRRSIDVSIWPFTSLPSGVCECVCAIAMAWTKLHSNFNLNNDKLQQYRIYTSSRRLFLHTQFPIQMKTTCKKPNTKKEEEKEKRKWNPGMSSCVSGHWWLCRHKNVIRFPIHMCAIFFPVNFLMVSIHTCMLCSTHAYFQCVRLNHYNSNNLQLGSFSSDSIARFLLSFGSWRA